MKPIDPLKTKRRVRMEASAAKAAPKPVAEIITKKEIKVSKKDSKEY